MIEFNVTNAPPINFDAGARQGPAGATGQQGNAGTVQIGTTQTLAPGASATVTNTGTSGAAVLNFGIPQGPVGPPGEVTAAQLASALSSYLLLSGGTLTGNLAVPVLFVGGSGGPQVRNNAGTVQFRNNANSSDAPVQCGAITSSGFLTVNTPASNGGVSVNGNYAQFNAIGASNAAGQFIASSGTHQGLLATYGDPVSVFGIVRTGFTVLASTSGSGLLVGAISGPVRIAADNAERLTINASGATVNGNLTASGTMQVQQLNIGANQDRIMPSTNSGRMEVGSNTGVDIYSQFFDLRYRGTSHAFRNFANNADAPVTCSNITASGWIDGAHRPFTFAGLPLASASTNKTFVCTDSTLPMSGANYGVTPAGGGSNRVKVFSNGTNWVLG